jgi:hypothetical protein
VNSLPTHSSPEVKARPAGPCEPDAKESSGPNASVASRSVLNSESAAAARMNRGRSAGDTREPSRAKTATKKHVILFLAANPSNTGRLALDREARSIHVELKRSGYRDRFDFVTRWAAEPLDLLRELRELKPTIVHFSGPGVHSVSTTDRAEGCDAVPATASSAAEPTGVVFDGANGRSL